MTQDIVQSTREHKDRVYQQESARYKGIWREMLMLFFFIYGVGIPIGVTLGLLGLFDSEQTQETQVIGSYYISAECYHSDACFDDEFNGMMDEIIKIAPDEVTLVAGNPVAGRINILIHSDDIEISELIAQIMRIEYTRRQESESEQ